MSQAYNKRDVKTYPRRWIDVDGSRGCYFPSTNINVGEAGGKSVGVPEGAGIVWLDSIDDLPWVQYLRMKLPG